MSTSSMSKSSQPFSQVDKFRDLARELEADEDPQRFEDTVRRIAKTPTPPPPPPEKPTKGPAGE